MKNLRSTKSLSHINTNESCNSSNYELHLFQKDNKPSILYLFYRWIQFVVYLAVGVFSIIYMEFYTGIPNNRWKWFIYFTNWVYMLCVVQSFSALTIAQLEFFNKRYIFDNGLKILIWYEFYEKMYTTAFCASHSVTLMYWLAIYDPAIHILSINNFMMHGGNCMLLYLDFLVVCIQWRMKNMIWSCLMAVSYLIFSFSYYLGGGTARAGNQYIYSVLNWNKPKKALFYFFLSTMQLVVFHCLIYIAFEIRRRYMNQSTDRSLNKKRFLTDLSNYKNFQMLNLTK